MAKMFQVSRVEYIRKIWKKDKYLHGNGINLNNEKLNRVLEVFSSQIEKAKDVQKLLQIEATMTKALYLWIM